MKTKFEESVFYQNLIKLSLQHREFIFAILAKDIEKMFDCKIKDRSYGDLGRIDNLCIPVFDSSRNICYLKEFVPNSLQPNAKI